MNKKFFIGLLILSLMILSGGCGGSSGTPSETNVNTVLQGAWSSSTNGTASITSINPDSGDLEAFTAAFGELPAEVVEQYRAAQKNKTVETVNVPVTRAMAFFDECDIEQTSGTAKFTAIIILSNDSLFLPVFYNGVTISTQRNDIGEWTAVTSDGGTLSISMTSEEKINLSGTISYLDYNCEFSTVIEKNIHTSLDPQTILDGTWKLDNNQGGGYLADNSNIIALIVPEAVSMYFENTKQESSTINSTVASFYSLYIKSTNTASNEEASILQTVNAADEARFIKVNDNIYKFTQTNIEGIIFVENTDEIFVFMTESGGNSRQTCMFLPLKRVTLDIEAALSKNWTAFDGGGYMKLGDIANPNNDPETEYLKSLDTFSFTLQNGTLNFSGVTLNADGTITAKININTSLLMTNTLLDAFLELAGIPSEPVTVSDSWQVNMTRSGNFLSFTDNDNTVYNLVFISDKEAFLSITNNQASSGEGKFVFRFN